MATNIRALPLVNMSVVTGNNEDWLDSIKYVVQQDVGAIDDWPQLDMRGISFEMEIRRSAEDHEVILAASTANGMLAIGAPPDYGYLLINVPLAEMKSKFAGAYVGDVRATADDVNRVAIQISNLTIVEGCTKSP